MNVFSYEKVRPCTCTINAQPCLLKSRQASLWKSLKYYWCRGKFGSLLKKNWPPNFLSEKMGKPQSCDYSSTLVLARATYSCLRHPVREADWGTPAPSSLVHASGAPTRLYQTLSSVNSSTTPQTPMEHLEVELGKVPRPERCKPNLGFPVVRRVQQPPSADIATPERAWGELNSYF